MQKIPIERISLPELGYTPKNLQAVKKIYGLTSEQVAEITGVAPRTAQRWEKEPDGTYQHSNMHVDKWRKLLHFLSSADCVAVPNR